MFAAYSYYDYDKAVDAVLGAAVAETVWTAILPTMLFSLAVAAFLIACMWIIYKKAGKNGWEAIVPIYNLIVMMEIVELPTWYVALFFLPIANLFVLYKVARGLAEKFGSDDGFWILLFLLPVVGYPILAFDKKRVFQDEDAMVAEAMQNIAANPAAPAQPAAPVAPAQPAAPVAPAQPAAPAAAPAPVAPAAPAAPAPAPAPVAPAPAPAAPAAPIQPAAPAAPAEPTAPINPINPAGPATPAQ
ncbi:MAG: DUF5684 domain-containing protein [Candidatus Saccharibacteria bacterium]|nr:DUF5684 domain-containing protein [Candidatus Saccharibacteria bacterium]